VDQVQTVVERLPPHNREAEIAVLGSLLIDRSAVERIASFLQPEDFYVAKHGAVYAAALAIYQRGDAVDVLTVADELQRQEKLEELGGVGYLAVLSSAVPTSVHVEHYARIVERCAVLRRLIRAAEQIAAIGFDERNEVQEALDKAEQALFAVARRRSKRDFVALQDALRTYFDQLDYLHQHKGEVIGVPTGYRDLDRLMAGLHPSDLIIVAGRPSVGKTAFVLGIAHHVALHQRLPVAIFSLEMSVEQLVQRLLSSESKVDSHRLRTGFINEHEWHLISQAFGALAEAPIYIDDTANLTVLELRTKARRLKAEADIQLVIVDYLQLMHGRGQENRVQEVAEISRGLKALARELSVPVVALSQLSRAVESRQDHRPILSDLRESGSIEQDADVVIFLHREELYKPDTDKKNIAEVIVAKHRHGPTATLELRFFPQQTRFADLERFRQPE
jgi:replicative DNA helicase